MSVPRSFKSRILESRAFGGICRRLGIDSRQYRLLLDLFDALGNRQEFMNTNAGINKVSGIYFGLSCLASLVLVLVHIPLPVYLYGFLGYSALILLMMVLQDACNSLMNPNEASILAHQPIRGATYVAAKLTHILLVVGMLMSAVNLPPAIGGLFLAGTRWYYPLSHLTAAFTEGLFIAFLICGVCGWMFLFISPASLKNAAMWMQLIFIVGPIFLVRVVFHLAMANKAIAGLMSRAHMPSWMPLRWFVALGIMGHAGYPGFSAWEAGAACLVSIAFIGIGFRAFRQDYLIRASALVQGSASSRIRALRRPSRGAVVRYLTGAQSGWGAFSFVSIMMRRDWHFRRTVIPYAVLFPFSMLAIAISSGTGVSPFQGFSPVFVFPHVLGLMAAGVCRMIPYTAEPQGAAIFISLPMDRLVVFARSLYLSLWIPIVGIMHICLLVPCVWLWGGKDALLFVSFSVALVSFYLGLMLLMISGLPFANRLKPSAAAEMQLSMLVAIVLALVFAGIQWVVFHSAALVVCSAIVLALLSFAAAHLAFGRLETRIRDNLRMLARPPQSILKEPD